MARKDPRYNTIKLLIKHGEIKEWKDIFKHIPKSIIRLEFHTNNTRMSRLVSDPSGLQYDEGAILASLIGVDHRVISALVENTIKELKRTRKA